MSETLMKLPELNGLKLLNEYTTFKKIAEEIAECNEAVEILNEYEDTHNSNCLLLSDEEIYKIREEYKVLLNNVMGEIMDIAQTSASQLFIFEKYNINIQELFKEYISKESSNTSNTQMIFQTKDNCRYVYFSPTNIDTSLRSTMNEIILSLGKIAQLGKFTGENGETAKIDKTTSNQRYVYQLFDIIQNCFNLLYSMESKYHINLRKLFEDHINKLIRKKYYNPTSNSTKENVKMGAKSKLKKRLLEIPLNDGAFSREKCRLANDLNIDVKKIEFYLNELCEKDILLKKTQYICPNCRHISTVSDEMLKDMITGDGCYECDDCCSLVNPEEDKTGYVFYDIKNKEGLVNW